MAKLLTASSALLATSAVYADSISPTSFSATVAVGGSTTVHKTVTVTAGAPTSAKVDVFFLADTTGSMGGPISSVIGSASSILSSVAALGDVAFGVGEYKDVGDVYTYRLNTDFSAGNSAAATAGIGLWGASGGGDTPEANLFGLSSAATGAAWRPGSARILVWFGDAPGHDPSSGVTEASATAALVGKSIKVEAVDVGALNSTGQASRIATATGGAYFPGISTSTIVSTITSAISSSFATYSTVALDLSEVPVGVTATSSPTSFTGSFDRSITRTFEFDLTFTGTAPGTYSFNTYATVDGGRIATEADRIVVGAGVPDAGSSLLLLSAALTGVALLRRRMQRMV